MPERREKIICIDERRLVELFNGDLRIIGNVVPADAQVVGVWPNVSRRAFDVVVAHPSFDPVPHGAELPVEVCEFEMVDPIIGVVADSGSWRNRPSLL